MSNVIKKSEVTEYMMSKRPIRTRDIGAGAKILVLEPVVNGRMLTCLERDGVRTNFCKSKVQSMSGKKYIVKTDGVHENGSAFVRYVEVSDLCHTHRRIRNATSVIAD